MDDASRKVSRTDKFAFVDCLPNTEQEEDNLAIARTEQRLPKLEWSNTEPIAPIRIWEKMLKELPMRKHARNDIAEPRTAKSNMLNADPIFAMFRSDNAEESAT